MNNKRNNICGFKLLIFDWDGTVADSLQNIISSVRFAANKLGLPDKKDNEIKNIIGLGLDDALQRLFPEIAETNRSYMAKHYRNHYLSSTADGISLFPGAQETIKQLHNEGYDLAVATGKSRRGLDRALLDSGLDKYFHYSRCADETFSKPHPQMVEDIIDMLGAERGKALMIGDSEHDLQMAINAGISSAAVSYGAQNSEYLLQFKPVTCLNSLRELPQWLNRGENHPLILNND